MAASMVLGSVGDGAGSPSPAPAPAPVADVPLPLKPLEELTEADIRQLTREDCRRYLKERGMRRPSWNKAQAIQQVLSLRSLMCPPPDPVVSTSKSQVPRADHSAADAHPKPFLDKVSQQSMPDSSPSNNASDPRPPPAGCLFPTLPVLNPDPKLSSLSSRDASPHRAQLTIFYSGIVNVYDDIPLDKAQAIMLLAASKTFQVPTNPAPVHPAPQQQPQQQHPHPHRHHHHHHQQQQQQQHDQPELQETTQTHPIQHHHAPKVTTSAPTLREESSSAESGLPQVRSASLQRFLAKRRDRLSGNPRRSDRPKKRKLSSSSPPRLTPSQLTRSPAPSSSTAAATTTITTTTAMVTAANDPQGSSIKSQNSSASASSDTSGGNSRTLDSSDDLAAAT